MEVLYACKRVNKYRLKELLNERKNPNYQDEKGLTGLMHASMTGSTEIVECLLNDSRTDSGHVSNNGCTALMIASMHGYPKIVELLLATDRSRPEYILYGETALDIARGRGHTEIVKLIEEYKPIEAKFAGKKK